ncbi:hypothetical protein KIH39_07595 [Telmatocola sphagniphila]|jgi:hypothetical protein|uniref:Uncharacterized protein n=1 Tax=Telmatocola sphagniphila TaxID=1123043 RepID=A0A8E6EZR9_9BACT|nr:hypothetical protein [Telmatocola sphagniphila]QVL33761.1 hypothetical protein KIH39_07595 [Telmatocola sphagniphila]
MLLSVMTKLDGRYLKSRERADLKAYIGTIRNRRTAYDEIRRKALPVAEGVIAEQRKRYPDFAKIRPQGFEKGTRDIHSLTNIAANMMLQEATEFYDSMFTEWYRTILKAVHMSPQFLQDTFKSWQVQLEVNLTADTHALLRPYVQHLTDFLLNVPVPVKDETGRRLAQIPASV